jgi:uroporphyrinogen-III decarboxylase
MTNAQWEELVKICKGEKSPENPAGFIIDSPWLPGWYGVSLLDYYTSDRIWFEANQRAIETFPEVMFLPGFWSEYGMCTEPSAFGAKMVWSEISLPHADRILDDPVLLSKLTKPDVKSDGLLPFMLNRLRHSEADIRKMGHEIKFAISRGPLNIASFLAGTTELMLAMSMNPEEILKGLSTITDFIIDWLSAQIDAFPGIEGILVLDDIVGFLGDEDFNAFALPYLKQIFQSFEIPVKLFHNDAHGLVCAPYLDEIGVNIFNFSFEHSIAQMRELAGDSVVLLGNIPPRDVLANGSPEEVHNSVLEMMKSAGEATNVIWSCGGGMPPDVPTENIRAFISSIKGQG